MKDLSELAGISDTTCEYKALQNWQVKRSEACTRRIIKILEENFINPFGVGVDQESVHNSVQD